MRVRKIVMFGMDIPCDHAKTEMMTRREGVDYVRCLECDQVFEAEDLEPAAAVYEDE